jgi:hypothetical protein
MCVFVIVFRVAQNRAQTPYITVCMMITLLETPYIEPYV